jgi:hypothetical protein
MPDRKTASAEEWNKATSDLERQIEVDLPKAKIRILIKKINITEYARAGSLPMNLYLSTAKSFQGSVGGGFEFSDLTEKGFKEFIEFAEKIAVLVCIDPLVFADATEAEKNHGVFVKKIPVEDLSEILRKSGEPDEEAVDIGSFPDRSEQDNSGRSNGKKIRKTAESVVGNPK